MAVKERRQSAHKKEVDPGLRHRVFIGRQAGKWHAISLDFTIVGQGDTPYEAFERMEELLDDYFLVCARDGISPESASRPIPLGWRVRLYSRVLLGRLHHLIRRPTTPPSLRFEMPHRVAGC